MYIKKVKKRNPGSTTVYEYLHLVENVRTQAGPRQRLILNLGSIDIPPEKHKELANCIEGMLLGQPSLFSADSDVEKVARQAVKRIFAKESESSDVLHSEKPASEMANIDVSSIQASEVRMMGPEYVGHAAWEDLGLGEKLLELGVSPHVVPTLEMLVVGRLVSPGSERSTFEWAQQRSAIFEFAGKPLKTSLSALYRGSDLLMKHKDALEAHLSRRERDLFSLSEKLCFFDLTNTYFEGEMLENSKAQHGKSKENRTDCKLLTLALMIDESGFAKYSRIFSGNQYEGKTLATMIEGLETSRPDVAGDRTVILDAGIANAENLAYLRQRNWHYIVVNRGNASFTPEDLKDLKVLRQDPRGEIQLEVKRRQEAHETFLLCRSKGRREKDKAIRSRQEKSFLERLEYYRQGLSKKGHTKQYPKVLEMIGRLREKYPGASKLYDIEVTASPATVGKKMLASHIAWKKKPSREHEDSWDGCYILRTSRLDLNDQEIWETYTTLTRIEQAFRTLKTSLGLRPNFHQKECRADAHLFISVLAYHLLHWIEWKLRQHGDYRYWQTIRQVLSTHQRLTLEFQESTSRGLEQRFLRFSSKPEVEHKIIYQWLGIKTLPLPRKFLRGTKISSDEKKREKGSLSPFHPVT